MVTGWTWEYIDEFVTIPRLLEMSEYWTRYPPLHEMIAVYFGLGKKQEQVYGSIDDLLREFGAAGGIIGAPIDTSIGVMA